jgi:large subunit ribosomal protein L21
VYAVVQTGGKQYRVEAGRAVKIERIEGDPGDTVELGEVLLMADGDNVTVGAPTISGARVVGTIAEQGRTKKIVVFRYKAKTRQRTKTGHRQHFTRIVVDDILAPGEKAKPREKKAAPPPPEPTEEESITIAEERLMMAAHEADADVAAPDVEAAPEAAADKPKRRSRKKTDTE